MSAELELANALQASRDAHFSADGWACDYGALASGLEWERLAACLVALVGFDPHALSIRGQTASWLNAYNASSAWCR